MKTPLTKNLIIKHVGESAVTFGEEYPYPAARPAILEAIQGPNEPPTLLCWTGKGYERLMPIADITDPTNITGCALKFDSTLDYIDVYKLASIDPNRLDVSDGKLIGAEFAYEGRADANDTQALLLSFGSEGGGTEVVPNPGGVDPIDGPFLTSVSIAGTDYKIGEGVYEITTSFDILPGNGIAHKEWDLGVSENLSGYSKIILHTGGIANLVFERVFFVGGLTRANIFNCVFDTDNSNYGSRYTILNFYDESEEAYMTTLTLQQLCEVKRYYAIRVTDINATPGVDDPDEIRFVELHAIVDAEEIDSYLAANSADMDWLDANFQTLAQNNPSMFQQILENVLWSGVRFGKPPYVIESIDNTPLLLIEFNEGVKATFGLGEVISLDTDDIPGGFESADLSYTEKLFAELPTY